MLKYQTGRLSPEVSYKSERNKTARYYDSIRRPLCADSKIRKAAMATGDSRIIGLSSRDLVAAEA